MYREQYGEYEYKINYKITKLLGCKELMVDAEWCLCLGVGLN